VAVTAFLYGSFPAKLANKEIDWDSDTIKVALTTSTYTPNQDTHDYFNDITNEVTGAGYSSGGATLASKTVTYTSGTNTQAFDAADVTWTSSTITARYAVIYDSTGVSSTSALIGYVDFGADVISSGGDFTIQWNGSGIFTIAVS
jgi:hypothetical protein